MRASPGEILTTLRDHRQRGAPAADVSAGTRPDSSSSSPVPFPEETAVDQPTPVQNPLTLVMTARSPEAATALRATVDGLQALPRAENPVIAALDRLASVHFARFVFLDERRLAVITTYDEDFETYINDFVDEIGDVFDRLLAHIEPGLVPVHEHRQEFLAFVRAHDLGCVGPFYSAYPERTVVDIRRDDPVAAR
jgi:hypothetical protein